MPSNKDNRKDLKLGWHFLPADKKLEYGDGRKAEVGKTLSYTGANPPYVCHYGMHASPKIAEAARFNKGPVLCRVEVWGDVSADGTKFAGRHRKVLWMKALTKEDFKALFKAIGYTTYADDIDGYVDALGSACGSYSYKEKVEKWLDGWTKRNGINAGASFVYIRPEIDVKTLKSLLNDRFVKSESDLKKELGDAFDLSQWDDVIYDLSSEIDVLEVSDYIKKTNFGYESGYLLQRKQKKSGGKRKK